MALRTTLISGGALAVSYGGIANSTTINDRGKLSLCAEGRVSNTVINSGGTLVVYNGREASAFKTTLNSGGVISRMTEGSALFFDSTIVNQGAILDLRRFISASFVQTIENGGYVTSASSRVFLTFASNSFSGLELSGKESATVHSGTTANSTTVNSGGLFELFSSGSANNTVVNAGGRLFVSSGAVATGILENGGYVRVNRNEDATFLPNSFSGLVFSEYDSATVHSGTTAFDTRIGPDAFIYTFFGGIVSNTVVESNGTLSIDEGSAYSVTVNSGGYLHVSGGTATGIAAEAGAYLEMEVSPDTWIAGTSGGGAFEFKDGLIHDFTLTSGILNVFDCTVTNTLVSDGGSLIVSIGTASGSIVSSGGSLELANGSADATTVASDGIFRVNGGSANNTEIDAGGSLELTSGTADATTVASDGVFRVDGGNANNTTVNVGGVFSVSGGTANNTTVNAGGSFQVFSGGTLTGQMHFAEGAIVSIQEGAVFSFDISGRTDELPAEVEGLSFVQGPPDYSLTVSDSQTYGVYKLAEGAAGFDSVITVQSISGELSGTLLLGKTRNIGGTGYLLDLKNGTLTVMIGGNVDTIAPTVSDILVSNSFPTNQPVVITAVFGDDVEIASSLYKNGEDGEWTVYVDGATAYCNGTFYFKAVDAAGNESEVVEYVIDNIDVTAPDLPAVTVDVTSATNGNVTVTAVFSEDSVVKEYSLDEGQTWVEYTDAVLFSENGTIRFRAADMLGNISETVYEVSNIDRLPPEKPTITVNTTEPTFGNVMVYAEFSQDSSIGEYSLDGGETWNSYSYYSSGSFSISVSISDNRTILFRGKDAAGNMSEVASYTVSNIYHVISNVVLSGGTTANVSSGKTYDNTIVSSGGYLYVYSGGTANGVVIEPGAYLYVYSGGTTSNVVENGGYVDAASGAEVIFTQNTISGLNLSLYSDSATVHSGTIANDTTVNSGYFHVYSGGIANNTTVNSGCFYVLSGGTANDTTVNSGCFYVSSGGTANDTTVNSGYFFVSSGGKLTGQMTFAKESIVSAYNDSILDFDISGLAPEAAARINDLSIIRGTPNYTLTVSDSQEKGAYILAENAEGFQAAISVQNTFGESFGTLAIGGVVASGDNSYKLGLNDGALCLTVQARDQIAPTLTDIQVSTTEPTNQPVAITVSFTDNKNELKSTLYKFGEDGEWTVYADGVSVYHNTSVYFKAVDLEGNESEIVGHMVSNIENLAGVSIPSGQSVSVLDGESFSDMIILSGGTLSVSSGGVLNGATAKGYGSLSVLSGGTATGIDAEEGASLLFEITPDTWIAGTSGGTAFEFKDGIVSDYVIKAGLIALSGGTADNVSIYSGGRLSISSGDIANGVKLENGALTVASGGTALNVDKTPFTGRITIQDGAIVTYSNTCTGVYYGRRNSLISHDAVLMSQGIESSYELYVMSDGKTLDMVIYRGGALHVSSGGTAVLTEVESSGTMYVSSGGTAIGTIINSAGSVYIDSGAAASGILLGRSARLDVISGAVANNVALEEFGSLSVKSGGIANGVSFCFYEASSQERFSARVDISSGGTMTSAVIDSGVRIGCAGTIDGVTVSSGCQLAVSSNGKLTGRVKCEKGAVISVSGILDFDLTRTKPYSEARYTGFHLNGASHYTITVNADQAEGVYTLAEGVSDSFDAIISVVKATGEEIGVFSGFNTITISNVAYQLNLLDGVLTLEIGGNLDPATSSGVVAADGSTVSVGNSEVFYGTVIHPGGTLLVSAGGKALETVENGGYADIRDGSRVSFAPNSFSGVVLSNASATVHSGTTATGVSIQSGGCLHVFSGGIANDIEWTPCVGQVHLDDGASATFAGTYSGVYYGSGDRLLSNAESMTSVILGSSCEMFVMSGGTASGAIISRGGRLSVSSGGTATDIVWTPCEGHVYLSDGASATFADAYSGVYFGSGDRLLSHAESMKSVTLDSSCEMFVMSDGIANDATVNSSGSIFVNSGGFAYSVTVNNGGSMHISSGGILVSAVISSGGRMMLSSGGTAAGIRLLDSLLISSGAEVTGINILSGGAAVLDDGAMEYAFVSNGGILMHRRGLLNGMTVSSGGSFLMSAGGTATDITISSGAYFGLSVDRNTVVSGVSNGSAFGINGERIMNHVISSGYLAVLSGACIADTTVLSGGTLLISSGAKLNGKVQCSQGGVISAFDGAVVDFELSQMLPGLNPVLNLSSILGTPSYSITVDGDPTPGRYKLANGAAGFNQTISVISADGIDLGFLTVGESITVSNVDFTLQLSQGELSLQVGKSDATTKTVYGKEVVSYTVSSGWTLCDTIVNAGRYEQWVNILYGGRAYRTTVNEGGKVCVSYGGIAYDTVIHDMGVLNVSSGGRADLVIFSSTDNSLYVSSGAEVNHVTFLGDGELFVLTGGKLSGADFKKGGMLIVSSGGTATDVNVSSGVACMFIVAPGTCVTGTSAGSSFAIKNGVASNCGGDSSYLYVMSDGIAYDTVLKDRCFLRVSSGGTACNTVVSSNTTLYVSSGGVLTGRTFIESGAYVTVEKNAIIDFAVYMIEPESDALYNDLSFIGKSKNGGTPIYTLTVSDSQKPGTYILASKGSPGSSITVRTTRNETLGKVRSFVYGDNRFILSGTELTVRARDLVAPTVSNIQVSTTEETLEPVVITADFEDNNDDLSATLYKLGENGSWKDYTDGVTVSRNTTVYFMAKDADGNESEIVSHSVSNIVYVSSGLVLTEGQVSSALTGDRFYDTVISSGGTLHLSSGGMTSNTVVESGGVMVVSSGGTAVDNTEDGGSVLVEDGATVSFSPNSFSGLNLSDLAAATVHSGTTACGTVIGPDGRMTVFSGGIAVETTVNAGGSMTISSGGTATGIAADAGACLYIELAQDTCVAGTSNGVAFDIRDGYVSGYTVQSGCLTVCSGAVADDTAIRGGSMTISSGGTATGIVANGGATLNIELAQNTRVAGTSGDVTFDIRDGYVSGYTVQNGCLTVCSGAVADDTAISGGSMTISSGGTGDRVQIRDGRLLVSSGGTANAAVVSGGSMTISSGGTANNTELKSGNMYVSSGGMAVGVSVSSSGKLFISPDGIASNVEVASRGSMTISSGGKLTGRMVFDAGSVITAGGAIIDFDISELHPENIACATSLYPFRDKMPNYTLTISENQEAGVYTIAEDAFEFNRSITVQNKLGESFGSVQLTNALWIGNSKYSLKLDDFVLYLSIVVKDETAPTISNIRASLTAPTNQNVMITADFQDDGELESAWYKLGEDGKWIAYKTSVTVARNTTVFFKAVDAAGNESEIASYEVTNIDKDAPVITLTGDTETLLKQTALTAAVDDGSPICYRIGEDAEWEEYKDVIPVTANGMYYFKATDTAGNVGTNYLTFENIQSEEPAPAKKKWTYMVYMAADSNIGDGALYDIIGMQQAKVDSQIDIYVLADRCPVDAGYPTEVVTVNGTYTWDSLWPETRVGKITYSPGLSVTVDWESWGELDTASSETLKMFVDWAQEQSPADNYGLILWDHGGENAKLCWDLTTDPNWNACFTVSEVSDIVKEKGNIPIVIFNNCLLASEIVATQMAGSTEVIVASEPVSMSESTYNYNAFFNTITADMTPQEMAEIMVQNVVSPGMLTMLSSIDVTDSRLGDALEALADVVAEAGNDADKTVLMNAMFKAHQDGFCYSGSYVQQSDLGDMIRQVMADSSFENTSAGFKKALADVKSVLEEVVLAIRSVPVNRGTGIAYCNTIATILQCYVTGRTPEKMKSLIQSHLTSSYKSNPLWGGLLYDLGTTFWDQNQDQLFHPASFDVMDVEGLVEGRTISAKDLGCFSGKGEQNYGIALFGEAFCRIVITDADKSTGTINVDNESGKEIRASLLASDGSVVVAEKNQSISFENLAPGNYYLRLQSETNCDVTVTFDANWMTGVDRFDYAGSGQNLPGVNGNGSIDTATILDAGYYTGLLTCKGDTDYYRIGNIHTEQYTVVINGNADWTVAEYDKNGTLVRKGQYSELDNIITLTMDSMNYLLVEGTADMSKPEVNRYFLNIFKNENGSSDIVLLDDLTGSKDEVSWESSAISDYVVEYSTDDFEHVLRYGTRGTAVDMLNLPGGTYQWRVKANMNNAEWNDGNAIVSDNASAVPKVFRSKADASDDIFFATPNGVWGRFYYAQHVGSFEDWTGTNEIVSANGKGRIQDLFFGSADPSTLCLTDSENGDALFLDDVYTGLPKEIEENTGRLFRLQTIAAGAGDDIVDMTSQSFEYMDGKLSIFGGDGDDIIWASKGKNSLFGDAGNDRIVGASGNDVIVGGIGNDRMHGGGGSDIFTFCDNWGVDNVEQLATGSVILWFAEGSMDSWDANTLTYTDGENSVKVSGVAAEKVTLKFGDDGSAQFTSLTGMGAFFDATTERIFEESGKGMLASL